MASRPMSRALVLLGLVAVALGAPRRGRADVILVVTTTADTAAADGACSLREAITAANGNGNYFECVGRGGGYDLIEFSLGAGTPVIQLSSALPEITGPLEIDGGPSRVELRGGGLNINGAATAGSIVRHLVLPNLLVQYTSNVLVLGNFIGTDASGAAATGGSTGIQVYASSAQIGGTNGLTPGGPCTGDCNLISGKTQRGLWITNNSSVTVRGNYIGTDRTGTLPLGNANGILVQDSVSTIGGPGAGNLISGNGIGITFDIRYGPCDSTIQGNLVGTDVTGASALPNGAGMQLSLHNEQCAITVGGTAAGAPNVISGSTGNGIYLITADDVVIHGNRIGTLADGVTPLPNGGAGVFLSSSTHRNRIGGVGAGEGNVIAWNATGVRVGINNYYNTVRGNSIHDNVGKGIQLDDGQANTAFTPILFGGSPIFGSVPGCAFCTVDVYSDDADEGRSFAGSVQADDQGSFVFAGPLSGRYVTATSTSSSGSTSEFSVNVPYDSDVDGVPNVLDNCILVANPSQLDSDDDGYGNRCDGDLNNSRGLVNSVDLNLFRQRLGTVNALADLDGIGGLVNSVDLFIFRSLLGKPPGPSGLVQ